MLGVQTYFQTSTIHRFQYVCQFIEFGPNVLPRASHILHRKNRSFSRSIKHNLQSINHLWQHCLKPFSTMASCMHDHTFGTNLGS